MDQIEQVDPDQFGRWVEVRKARIKLCAHFDDWATAETAVIRRLCAGLLKAAAAVAVLHFDDRQERSDRVVITPNLWQKANLNPQSIIWASSEFDVDLRGRDRFAELEPESYVQFFGVRLDLDGLNAIAPIFGEDVVIADTKLAPARAKPGRKRAEWWDLLWIEMIRRTVAGTLKPKNQAGLEREMLDFLSEIGEFPGEGTLKRSAANLFKYIEEKRGH